MSANTALLVIDVQVNMFDEADPVYQGDELLLKINHLLEKARNAHIPIIYIQHGSTRPGHPMEVGSSGWQIHPAIAPREGDTVIRKSVPDSFQDTRLQEALADMGVKNLVISGIQTELCVDTTSRSAFRLGYDVTLVKDAHSTWERGALTASQIIDHHNSLLEDWFVTLKAADEVSFA